MALENEKRERLWFRIVIVLALYVLQGVTLGLVEIVPYYLTSFGATWKELGIWSFVMYPFSLKLLWAPLIDVLYIRRLGRRRTWLLPTQLMLGTTFIILSFYFESLLVQLRVTELTVIIFFVVLLTATQDICVDGWSLILFGPANVIWQSISQMIGQPFGSFLGSPILLTFESANMTNRLIRQPFGLTDQPYGLFTLAQFLRFWGVMFFITTSAITFLFREKQQNMNMDRKDHNADHFNLLETYLYILRLFKKKCFRQLLVILLGSPIGYVATLSMTFVTLIKNGTIKRETLGLITMPLILIKVTIPFLLSRTRRPLIFLAQSYVPRLILCIIIALFVYFSSRLSVYPAAFYSLLVVLLALNDALIYLQGAARGGFLAAISDTRIGSTYYTLLAALSNLGGQLSSSAVLYSANWLPKEQAYYIEVAICVILGSVWLCISWQLIYRLQAMPVGRWHLPLRKGQFNKNHCDHHEIVTADTKKMELPTIVSDTEPSTWL